METPFDTLIDRLWQTMINMQQRHTQPSELFSVVEQFTKIARVLYITMRDTSEKLWLFTDAQIQQQSTRPLTLEETRERTDGPIRCRLSYFQFIEHTNRTGRVLQQNGHTLPLYGRIYFFRNKMVEHWDDYLQFILEGNGLLFSKGKIAIPYAFSDAIRGDLARRNVQQELTEEFARSSVALPSLEGKWQGEYTEIIYASLEQIDSKLRRIPEALVRLLFKYSFPTPITDMENYCTTLAAWLEAVPVI